MASGNRKHRAHRAWAGLCLAALLLAPAGTLFGAETGKRSFIEFGTGQQPGHVDVQGTEPDFATLGGALYNPFSPAFETVATTPRAAPSRREGHDESHSMVSTTVAAFIAAGCLGLLLRFLVAS